MSPRRIPNPLTGFFKAAPWLLLFCALATTTGALPVLGQGRRASPAPTTSQLTLPETWVSKFTWRSIGPANMSGRITALAVNPKDSNTWWAASASGGLLKTTNNGVSFEHQFDRQATVSIGDVQVAPFNPNIVWVGTGEANPRNSVSWGDGVYKSTDGGKTWKNMGLKKIFQTGRIAIHPENPDVVYVGALGRLWGPNEERGVFKTVDGGKTWTKTLYIDDKTGIVDLQMSPADPEILIAAAYERQRDGFDGNDPANKFGPGSGLYKTTNGGKNWKRLTEGLPSCNLGRIGLCYYRKDPNYVYAIIETERIGQWPEKSPYVGLRGENAEVGAKIIEVTKDGPAQKAGLKKDDIVLRVNDKTVHSYNQMLEVIRNHEAGAKLKLEVSRSRKSEVLNIELAMRPEVLQLRRQERAAQRNRAGDQEKDQDTSTESEQKIAQADDEEEEESEESTSDDAEPTGAKSTDAETKKETAAAPRRDPARWRRNSPFAGSLGGQRQNMQQQQGGDSHQFGGVYRSADGGETWTRINSVNPRPMYYSQIRVDPSDNNYIWVLGTSLYRSKDGGETFTPDGARRGVHVDHHAMWIDPLDGRRVILGNDGGIYVTYDRGEYWDHHNHIAIGQFYHVGVDGRRNYNIYGGLQDNGSWGGPSRVRSGSGPVNTDWFRIGSGDGFICLVDPHDHDQLYFESQNGAMGRRHLRTGERGFIRPRPQRGQRYRFNWKTPFILSPHNSQIHYSAGNFVFRSIRKGDRPAPISPEITNTNKGSGSAISESPREEGVLYVGTTDGALWVTRNGGQEWVNLFKEPEKASSPAPARGRRSTTGSRPGPAAGAGGRRGQMTALFIRRMDRDRDGAISKDELPPPIRGRFDDADKNKDGKLDTSELAGLNLGRRGGRARGGPPRGGPRGDWPQRPSQPESTGPEPPAPEKKPAQPMATAAQKTSQPDPISGVWRGRFISENMPAERARFTLTLRLSAEGAVSGSYRSTQVEGEITDGKFDRQSNKLTATAETGVSSLQVTATLSDKKLSGEINVSDRFQVPFEATRSGDAPERVAQDDKYDWKPIKDLVPGPRWVSSIEASRFQNGRCYITLDGHRSDDDAPYTFVTENHGRTWRSLTTSLPATAGSCRVIREDVQNANVLYLGTEFGCWVTIDRGESWTKLNGNLPTVAVHEIAVHPVAGEIVAGTHGRSIWILDVTALRQFSAERIKEDAYLYQPNSVIRWRSQPTRGSSGTRRFVGQNPSSSAHICYSLGKNAGSVELEVYDVRGQRVRRLEAANQAGLHQVTWNLSRDPRGGASSGAARGRGGRGGGGVRRRGGRTVPTGSYLVKLTVDGKEYKQPLQIETDPDYPPPVTTDEEWEFLEAIYGAGEEEEGEVQRDEDFVD